MSDMNFREVLCLVLPRLKILRVEVSSSVALPPHSPETILRIFSFGTDCEGLIRRNVCSPILKNKRPYLRYEGRMVFFSS